MREARGWGRSDLAREMKRFSTDLPSVRSLAHSIRSDWETGAHKPGPRNRSLLAQALGVAEVELFGSAEAPAPQPLEDDEVNRRRLLGLLGAAAAAGAAQQFEPVRARLNDSFSSAPTMSDADDWERVAFDYSFEVGALAPERLLPELLTDVEELHSVLNVAQGTVRQHLLRASANMAALTAIALLNAEETRAAGRWWRTAARAASECGDHALAARVRGRQAVFSVYGPSPGPRTLSLADDALAAGGSIPCGGVASAHAAKAQAYAYLGRFDDAEDALRDLERTFELLPEDVRVDRRSQWGWSEQRLYHVRSYVHTYAGDTDRAFAAQDRALEFYSPRPSQGRVQVELHRAGCLIRAGDIDEGARHAVRVLESVPPRLRHDGLLKTTAVSTLGLATPAQARSAPIRAAFEALALEPGGRR
ncbi:hypothetical protein EDD29_0025 [Actinocorallia herbida]|uniref:HTH cro/C1-type domain-containing protein n=2 Tax=Actinocorallia herbida TaxID=58109 RepID=A0A3N1CMW6_9ACTN|nr:hypothetical protein EDD29_0025 [Actinocorallia herbida]